MNQMRKTKKNVELQSRRMFLKSSGGYTLSIPFLTSLLTAYSEKAHAALPFPGRFVSLNISHGGLRPPNWAGPRLPTTQVQLSPGVSARVDSTTSLVSNNALSPVFGSSFSNLFPQLSLILGADVLAYYGHNTVLSLGANPRGTNGRLASDQNSTLSNVIGENPSIDHVLAFSNNGLYGQGARPVRRLTNFSQGRCNSWGRANYYSSDPVLPWDHLNSNAGVFSTLFGSLPPGGGTSTSTPNPLVNLVNEFWPSGRSLMSSLSMADRSQLEQLFQLASDTARTLQPIPGVTCSPTTPPNLNSSGGTTAFYNNLADIISMAFRCDVTRVFTLDLGEPSTISGYHDIVHNWTDPGNQAVITQVHQTIANQFVARLGNNLNVQDPASPGSTILNNSLIYWSAENTMPHDNFSQPIMLLGSAGGRIRSGYVADLRRMNRPVNSYGSQLTDSYHGDLLNRLWSSIFYAFNVPKSEYEVQRGGNSFSVSLNRGFGHVVHDTAHPNRIMEYTSHLARIGEPWEFLTRPTTVWD